VAAMRRRRPDSAGKNGKPDERKKRQNRRAAAALVVVTLLLSLVAAELLLRALGVQYPEINMLDPLVGWRPRPGVEGWYRREGEGYIRINREGYRDVDHPIDKPAGTYRIAVLGDSMTEGREVMLDELFWKRLESLLPDCPAFSGKRIETLGFAVNGYGTAQEYLTLEEHALKYHPDLVMLDFFPGNDFSDNNKALGRHRDRPYFALVDGKLKLVQKAGDAPNFARRRWWEEVGYELFGHLRLAQLFEEARSSLILLWRFGLHPNETKIAEVGLNSAIYAPPKTPDWDEAWAVSEALIETTAETAGEHGAGFVLVTLTDPIQVTPDLAARERFRAALGVPDLRYVDRGLAAFATAHGLAHIETVDSLALWSAEHSQALHGFDTGRPVGHMNALGHRLTAEAIASDLCAQMTEGKLAPLPAESTSQ
jgi:hypothetical protein